MTTRPNGRPAYYTGYGLDFGEVEQRLMWALDNSKLYQAIQTLIDNGGIGGGGGPMKKTWTWHSRIAGTITASAIDFPEVFVAPFAVTISTATASSQATLNWNYQILKSADEGLTWAVAYASSAPATNVAVYAIDPAIELAEGELIKYRFVNVGNNAVLSPQLEVLVQEA